MKKSLLFFFSTIVFCFSSTQFFAQESITDFENFNLDLNTFLNGSMANGLFESGDVILPNDYNAAYDSWAGWSISTVQDTVTPGFTNQYASASGSGNIGSEHYATGFVSGESKVIIPNEDDALLLQGLYINNNTYAYLSMRDGDAFAKKFGGETGDDPDFYRATFRGYRDGSMLPDSIDFYLADYRFDDNSQDYIINEWTFLDLSVFGSVDSLGITIASSDVGAFGINTPRYLCIDDITMFRMTTSVATNEEETYYQPLFPNPAQDALSIQNYTDYREVLVFNNQGQNVLNTDISNPTINISGLTTGLYHVILKRNNGQIVKQSIIKQ